MNSRHESKTKRLKADDGDCDQDENSVTHLVVSHVLPNFLDPKCERVIFSKQSKPVLPVTDPTCDMAMNAKRGSKLVREIRESKEIKKVHKKVAELENTQMGEVLKVKSHDDKDIINESSAYRDKYSKHYIDDVSNSFEKKNTIAAQRKKLPVYNFRDKFIQLIDENNIIIVVGETGSGKTTQLTQYLYEAGYGDKGMIACTQPRRVAAVSVAQRVATEMGVELGRKVGYSIRFEDKTSKETKIKYMTDGILLRETLSDPDLDRYSCIIMDEAHERSLNTDILFGLLREIVAEKRDDLKLIITSATMDASKFSDFFGGAHIEKVPGKTYEVDIFYSAHVIDDYVAQAVNKAIDIHLSEGDGDILVFLPGQEEIEVCCDKIAERLEYIKSLESNDEEEPQEQKKKKPIIRELIILPMYSALTPEKQARVFKETPNGSRKCVVATNIAETSLTIDGIKFVIDSGFSKLKVFQPKMGFDALLVYPISQANAKQRSGRAGRTSQGVCYRLYTENQFKNELLTTSVPEIQRSNLSNVILILKSLNVTDLSAFKFMDCPPDENITNSMYQLWMLGALDLNGRLTDPIGKMMSDFPLEPTMSKMLVESINDGCAHEVMIIVAMLSIGPRLFYRPDGKEKEKSDHEREKFYYHDSDHLTLLNVYKQWSLINDSEKPYWCDKNNINHRDMIKAKDIVDQLKDIAKSHKYKLSSTKDENIIKRCICKSYFHQAAMSKNLKEYQNIRTGLPCQLHPSSALHKMDPPKYIIYHELMMTTKEYMYCATAVEAEWLAELGPMFYSLRKIIK